MFAGVKGFFKSAIANAVDAYFNLTTLLLHGDGTNGAQNNTFLDSSSNNFNITRNGNATQGTFTPFSQTGWSNYFDGTGYLTLPSVSTTFGTFSSTSSFTIEGWIYQTQRQSGAEPTLFGDMQATGGLSYFAFGPNNNGYLMLYWYSGGNAVSTTTVIPLNTWTHIACSVSSGAIKLFVNGVLQTISGVSSFTAPAGSTGTLSMGRWNTGGSANGFFGYVSNFRVTNTAVYSSTFTPSTSPLTAITGTTLLTAQSNRFVDNSTNNQTFTAGNTVSVQAFSPFAPTAAYSAATVGGSGYFDGSGDYLTVPSSANLAFGTGDFTIEAWAYVTGAAQNQNLIDFRSGGTGNSPRIAIFNYGTTIDVGLSADSQLVATLPGRNAWVHIAVTRSGTTARLFVNGAVAASITDSTNLTQNGVYFGTYTAGVSNYAGYIAGARAIKGTALYTAAFTPPTAPPTAITNTQLLLNFTNGGIIDQTGKNVLETVGNAQISTSVKKYGTGSLAFDGTGDYLVSAPNSVLSIGTSDFTIEGWVNFASFASAEQGIVQLSSSAGGFSTGGIAIRYWNTAGKYWGFYADAISGGVNSSTSANTGTWYHFALVRNGLTTTLYVNGTSVASTTAGSKTDYANYNYLVVGGYYNSSYVMNGYIDDLRITKYARYTANFTPPTAAFADQ